MTDAVIEPMTDADWPAVRAIYEQGIATGNATFETEVPDRDHWDMSHVPACRLVARRNGVVDGWAALSPVSKRPAYSGVAEVSVYVSANARGHGVGRLLLSALMECAEAAGFWTLQASVFPENAATIRLHRSLGFREVGRRERIGRHNGQWRDTLLLELRTGSVPRS